MSFGFQYWRAHSRSIAHNTSDIFGNKKNNDNVVVPRLVYVCAESAYVWIWALGCAYTMYIYYMYIGYWYIGIWC